MLHTQLSHVLSRYPSRFQPTSTIESLGGAGGLSGARLWRYDSAAGRLALRAWPIGGTRRDGVERIHGWLRAASDLGFLALPVVARDGHTVTEQGGVLWHLEPWMPGVPDLADPPSSARVDAAFSGLASLHRRLAGHGGEGTSPGLAAVVRELEVLMVQGFDRLQSTLDRWPGGELQAAGRQWLAMARVLVPRSLPGLRDAARLRVPLQPCLRDARPEHFLFEEDRLTGLIDYGAMGIESVAADLARLVGEWLGGADSLRTRAISSLREGSAPECFGARPGCRFRDRRRPLDRRALAPVAFPRTSEIRRPRDRRARSRTGTPAHDAAGRSHETAADHRVKAYAFKASAPVTSRSWISSRTTRGSEYLNTPSAHGMFYPLHRRRSCSISDDHPQAATWCEVIP